MQMPDLIQDSRKFLTKEEQQQAIDDLAAKKDAHQAAGPRSAEPANEQAEKPR